MGVVKVGWDGLVNVHHFKGVGRIEKGDSEGTWENGKRRLGCRKGIKSVDMEW